MFEAMPLRNARHQRLLRAGHPAVADQQVGRHWVSTPGRKSTRCWSGPAGSTGSFPGGSQPRTGNPAKAFKMTGNSRSLPEEGAPHKTAGLSPGRSLRIDGIRNGRPPPAPNTGGSSARHLPVSVISGICRDAGYGRRRNRGAQVPALVGPPNFQFRAVKSRAMHRNASSHCASNAACARAGEPAGARVVSGTRNAGSRGAQWALTTFTYGKRVTAALVKKESRNHHDHDVRPGFPENISSSTPRRSRWCGRRRSVSPVGDGPRKIGRDAVNGKKFAGQGSQQMD